MQEWIEAEPEEWREVDWALSRALTLLNLTLLAGTPLSGDEARRAKLALLWLKQQIEGPEEECRR